MPQKPSPAAIAREDVVPRRFDGDRCERSPKHRSVERACGAVAP
jgi:hypothetical protein